MPDLDFQVETVEAVPFAAAPLLNFKLKITSANPDDLIQTVALRCQINIEPTRRQYKPDEQENLRDLFGESDRWNQTLKPLLWTHTSTVVAPFQNMTTADLPVNCTFDFNVAATKYFAGLDAGEIPLILLFSGTCFYENEEGFTNIAQISWSKETRFRLPVEVWRQMMDSYYPNSAWLNLPRETFDKLQKYKTRNGIPTLESALEKLLSREESEMQKSATL